MEVFRALASEPRVAILRYLGDRVVAVNQIAKDLNLPSSTATMHIAVLERAGLLHTELRPASRGLQKVCARTYDELVFDLPRGPHHTRDGVDVEMPIGGFSDFEVHPTCGLVSTTGLIGYLDDPSAFYEPDRLNAHCSGSDRASSSTASPTGFRPARTSTRFSSRRRSAARRRSTTWTGRAISPSGSTACSLASGRARRTSVASAVASLRRWWEEKDSQFGVLKRWLVTTAGRRSTDSTCPAWMSTLSASPGQPIVVRIGVRPDAANVGGLNLFGRGSATTRRISACGSNTEAARPESQRTACCEVVSAGSSMPSFGSVTGSGPRLGGPRSAAGRLRAEDDLAPALERRAAGGTPRRRGRSAARTAATISRYIPIPVPA